jgi:hypothetical protein
VDDLFSMLGLLALGASPCAVVYAGFSYFRTKDFIARSVEVGGEVVRLERSKYRDKYGYTYAPVFSFTAEDGKDHEVTSKVSSSPAGFAVGDAVRVRYDPANPADARIHTVLQTWGTTIIAGFGGIFLLVWGCAARGYFRVHS